MRVATSSASTAWLDPGLSTSSLTLGPHLTFVGVTCPNYDVEEHFVNASGVQPPVVIATKTGGATYSHPTDTLFASDIIWWVFRQTP